ncbi:hypothetical protein [Noviherbaspirillum aerium]|uniref:hypothetical protein n=1 Tax=Noviherbaspirillum aerium TaxID=2588497 RepID=UPI00124F119A|nr:hypothetical protein [Noviherbaspirillum aerium]
MNKVLLDGCPGADVRQPLLCPRLLLQALEALQAETRFHTIAVCLALAYSPVFNMSGGGWQDRSQFNMAGMATIVFLPTRGFSTLADN